MENANAAALAGSTGSTLIKRTAVGIRQFGTLIV